MLFLKHVQFDAGALVTFDKAYNDYTLLASWTQKGVEFVSRMKKNAVYQLEKVLPVAKNKSKKVLADQIVVLRYGDDDQPLKLRRIEFYDKKNDSNIFNLCADDIALIYQKRWEIECLFPLKYFLGNNTNAIEIQIWACLIANLIYTVIKGQLSRKWAFSNICSMIRLHLSNYIHLIYFLNHPNQPLIPKKPDRQPQLFV